MLLTTFLTKRWFTFFFIMYVIWYPISLLIVTSYEVTAMPILFIAGNVFTPLWLLLMSYLYFRNTRDDWSARFVTAFGWLILMFIISAILVKPIYGYSWTSIINISTINANWINLIAILVGGLAAHKTTQRVDIEEIRREISHK